MMSRILSAFIVSLLVLCITFSIPLTHAQSLLLNNISPRVLCEDLAYTANCSYYSECISYILDNNNTIYTSDTILYSTQLCRNLWDNRIYFNSNGQIWIRKVITCILLYIHNNANISENNIDTEIQIAQSNCFLSTGYCDIILADKSNIEQFITLNSNSLSMVDNNNINKDLVISVITISSQCLLTNIQQFIGNFQSLNALNVRNSREEMYFNSLNEFLNCKRRAINVVVIADTSGSVGNVGFRHIQSFLIDFAKNVNSFSTNSKYAIIDVSYSPITVLQLSPLDILKIETEVNLMAFRGGAGNTDLAIEVIANSFFNQISNPFNDVSNIVILLTDGDPTNITRAKLYSNILKLNMQVKFYILRVGTNLNPVIANEIASSPNSDYIINIPSYEQISFYTHLIGQQVCKTPLTYNFTEMYNVSIAENRFYFIEQPFPMSSGFTLEFKSSSPNILIGSFRIRNPIEVQSDFLIMNTTSTIRYISPNTLTAYGINTNTSIYLYLTIYSFNVSSDISVRFIHGFVNNTIASTYIPENLASQLINITTIQIEWTQVPLIEINDAIEYEIEFNVIFSTNSSVIIINTDLSNSEYIINTNREISSYTLRIRLINNNGLGIYSEPIPSNSCSILIAQGATACIQEFPLIQVIIPLIVFIVVVIIVILVLLIIFFAVRYYKRNILVSSYEPSVQGKEEFTSTAKPYQKELTRFSQNYESTDKTVQVIAYSPKSSTTVLTTQLTDDSADISSQQTTKFSKVAFPVPDFNTDAKNELEDFEQSSTPLIEAELTVGDENSDKPTD